MNALELMARLVVAKPWEVVVIKDRCGFTLERYHPRCLLEDWRAYSAAYDPNEHPQIVVKSYKTAYCGACGKRLNHTAIRISDDRDP